MPVDLSKYSTEAVATQVNKKALQQETLYKTADYARIVLRTLAVWDREGRKAVLLPSSKTNYEPRSLRSMWYLARAYVKEHPAEFTPEEQALMLSFSLGIQTDEPRGLIIREYHVLPSFDDKLIDLVEGRPNNDAYQQLICFITDEDNAQGAKLELKGPFTNSDLARFREALEALRGVYLSEISDAGIRVIYWPSGTTEV